MVIDPSFSSYYPALLHPAGKQQGPGHVYWAGNFIFAEIVLLLFYRICLHCNNRRLGK